MYYQLKAKMAVEAVTVEQVAEALHIHRNTAAAKIAGKAKFYIDELQTIRDLFFPASSLDELAQRKSA